MRDTTILGPAALLALAMSGSGTALAPAPIKINSGIEALAGVWLSADGFVRLTLKSDFRYDVSVRGRTRPAHGSYLLNGAQLRLRDDSGLWTPARLSGDVIEMAGHELLPG